MGVVMKKPELSEQDLERVERYLNSPNHQVERKPFRPWLLLGFLVLVLAFFSFFSVGLAWWHGVI